MSDRGVSLCLLLLSAIAGCESGAARNPSTLRQPTADQVFVAAYTQPPVRATSGKVYVVSFVRPSQDLAAAGGIAHVAVPVSLNDGPPRAFILDTGAPVTTVLISKRLLELAGVTQKLSGAPPTQIQGISGESMAAYRATARSIAVGLTRVAPFPYVLMSSDRNLSDLGQTPYGPVVGILGNDFLSRYRVTVDYQRGTVTLEDR